MRDGLNNIHPVFALAPVVVTDNTVQTSAAIDVKGFDSLTFLITTGTLSDADTTVAVKLTECDTSGGTYTDVAAGDTIGGTTKASFQFDDDTEVRKIGYLGTKRYVKCVATPANNTGNIPISMLALLGLPARRPTPNPPI